MSSQSDPILKKRRQTLLQRAHTVRFALHSLSTLNASYHACRDQIYRWRLNMLEQINRIYQESVDELNEPYEQLNQIRTAMFNLCNEQNLSDQIFDFESNLKILRNAQFRIEYDENHLIRNDSNLLTIVKSAETRNYFNRSKVNCRLLISRDQWASNLNTYTQLMTRIGYQTPEHVLIFPFDLLNELLVRENEIRLLIDQTYLPSIRSQTQRLLINYDLIVLQFGQEPCPQSTEFVVRLICHDSDKLFACIEEIYRLCNQLEEPTNFIPYHPTNYNRTKIHMYGGYPDMIMNMNTSTSGLSTKEDWIYAHSSMNHRAGISLNSSLSSLSSSLSSSPSVSSPFSSQNHFDRVLMPVSIRHMLTITDIQAGALLGPKGERIQQLQRETGAIVTISDLNECGERRKRVVYVQGSEYQVSRALQIIQKQLINPIFHEEESGRNHKLML